MKGWPTTAFFEGVQDIPPLFAASGDVASNPGKDPGSVEGAKTAGDSLTCLLHADVAFAAVVGEGHLLETVKASTQGSKSCRRVRRLAALPLGPGSALRGWRRRPRLRMAR